jgi:hypothetical protein
VSGIAFLNCGDNKDVRRYVPSGFTLLNYTIKILRKSLESCGFFWRGGGKSFIVLGARTILCICCIVSTTLLLVLDQTTRPLLELLITSVLSKLAHEIMLATCLCCEGFESQSRQLALS